MELNQAACEAATGAFVERLTDRPSTSDLLAALRFALEAYESVRLAAAPASQQEARLKVIDESASAHCCFAFTVVDTDKDDETMCETFDRADADLICAALNASSRAQRTNEGK